MRRRSSIITLNPPGSMLPANWQQTSAVDSRKMSTTSNQSNPSSISPKNNTDAANFTYQPPPLIRYPTVFSSICLGKRLTCVYIYITYAFLVSHFNETLVDWIYYICFVLLQFFSIAYRSFISRMFSFLFRIRRHRFPKNHKHQLMNQ